MEYLVKNHFRRPENFERPSTSVFPIRHKMILKNPVFYQHLHTVWLIDTLHQLSTDYVFIIFYYNYRM
jgi:hypothetical protein